MMGQKWARLPLRLAMSFKSILGVNLPLASISYPTHKDCFEIRPTQKKGVLSDGVSARVP